MSNITLKKKHMYVYELPYTERNEFCNVIDMNDKWKELGGKYMQFDHATLFKISKAPMRNNSYTDELLTLWGEQNHTVLELFKMLYEMQHYRAMTILKQFVDPKYHKWIYHGDKSFSDLIKSDSDYKDNNCNPVKINVESNRKKDNIKHEDLNKIGKRNDPTPSDQSLMFSSAEACTPLITYKELEQATNYWNKSNILGKGGFGVVFKGIWKNTVVAIKRLEAQKGAEQEFNILEAQRQQSFRELKYLNSCRHDNILSLYGFSIGGEKPCLVYKYMENGSLEDRLQCRQGTKPLAWLDRFHIATGSARGLQFLHGMDKPLIHGDIKSANILLDHHFVPHIGDFGLAREGPLQEYTHVKVSHVHGTRPYLPDEFLRGKKFSTKVDTYSFGVVLFEIASGQRAYDSLRNHKFLKDHVENYDGAMSDLADVKAGLDENNVFHSFMSIGKNCVRFRAKDRPEMEQVLRQLDCVTLQEKHQSTIRNSSLPTFPYEIQMRKLSTPSGSYHLQPLFQSPVPSNHLLKPNSTLVPPYIAVPDQVEGGIMSPIEEKICTKSMSNPISVITDTSSSISESSDSQSNSHSSKSLISKLNLVEFEGHTNFEKKDNNWKNSVPEENDDFKPLIPLISKLQIESNQNSKE